MLHDCNCFFFYFNKLIVNQEKHTQAHTKQDTYAILHEVFKIIKMAAQLEQSIEYGGAPTSKGFTT